MKTEEFRQAEKLALEMAKKAKEEYIEKGALANLRATNSSINTALRAAITELMYKNNSKNK